MTRKDIERRLRALEPPTRSADGGLYVRDLDAEIEKDTRRILEADDPVAEYARMLMETATARGGELSFEEALKIAEEINEVVYTPWLSKEHAEPGGRRRDGSPVP
ncbi:MAG: hypothetical protein PHN90_11150 [Methanothrix sp.]|nr:hypothetical protein [Methanothrix sp.]